MKIETKTTKTTFTATRATLTGKDIIDLMRKAGVFEGEIERFEVEVNDSDVDADTPLTVLIVHENKKEETISPNS